MHNKRPFILFLATSLDGYIADENGGVKWLEEIDGDGDNGYLDFYETVDTIIMGNTTYKQILSFGIEFPYKGKKCYVFSRSDRGSDENVEFVNEDAAGFIGKLKEQEGKNIWLTGGAELLGLFMKENLVDEFIITIMPIILGKGIQLFKEGNPVRKLSLVDCRTFDEIVQLHYK